jgi:ABC transporter substrate binding protein
VSSDAFRAFLSGFGGDGLHRRSALELRTTTRADQVSLLAAELVQQRVAVIAALGGLSAPATKAATTTTLIVFTIGGDPVELGLVSNLSRPAANVTGVTFFAAELLQKQVGIPNSLLALAEVIE